MARDDLPTLLTSAQVGRRLGIPTAEVERLAKQGTLACYRLGARPKSLRFDPADVMAYLATVRTGPVPTDVAKPAEPGESRWLDGLLDAYHDLQVGPYTAEMIEAEAGHRLVYALSCDRPDEFDCTYAEWVRLFKADVEAFERSGRPTLAGDFKPPTRRDLDAQTVSVLPRGSLVLTDGCRIERRGERWAIANVRGDYLEDLDEPAWIGLGGDTPSLDFATPLAAYRAHTRATAELALKRQRRKAAGEKLNRHLPRKYYGNAARPSDAGLTAHDGPWGDESPRTPLAGS